MTQTTFDSWTPPNVESLDGPPAIEGVESYSKNEERAQEASTKRSEAPADLPPCPWCWAPSSDFSEKAHGIIGCDRCEAQIPLKARWYRRGQTVLSSR
jgi:hypothetical protein